MLYEEQREVPREFEKSPRWVACPLQALLTLMLTNCILGLECRLVCGICSEWPLPLRMQRRPFSSSTGSLNAGSYQLRDRINVAVFTDTWLSEVCVYKLH